MDLLIDDVIGWRHPDGNRHFFGVITAIDTTVLTVDLKFADGSTRGAVPFAELEAVRPGVSDPISDILGIAGITSGEAFGKF